MPKTTYATDTNVSLILIGLGDDVSASLLAYGCSAADIWADSILSSPVSKTTTPTLVMQACEYYASATLLRILFDVSEEDSPTVLDYEKRARDLLGAYVASTADEASDIHPYSSSHTPSHNFTERDIRTVVNSDESERYYVEDEWDSER
jgi:hypothetical protein